jgi:phosphinothricin acetyltransferase
MTGSAFAVVSLLPTDWEAVAAIYQEGIATGVATFEQSVPAWEAWDAAHLPAPRLVALAGHGGVGEGRRGAVVGWAALSPVSSRCVYGGVAEVSVYVAAAQRGGGIGRALLEALVAQSEAAGFWTLQAGIFPENVGSVALHHRCGFRTVGRREKLGQLHGLWRDVLLLERRSQTTGV